MWESIVSGLAVPVLEQLGRGGRFLIGQARDARKDVQKIEADIKALREYPKRYEALHGQVKIMPGLMKEPMPLDSIYTAVKFLDDDSRRYFASSEDLERFYREQGKRNFETAEKRHDGMSIAKEKPYLMVLGGPGIGKSTFLKKLGLEAFKGEQGQLQSERIPVFIELKTLRSQSIDLVGALAKELEICGLSNARAFTELSLKKGSLLILLDGLDEVPTANTNRVIEKIEAFVRKYRKNAFVASCRTAAYHSSFKQFSDVTIADFDDEQIEQFIRRWFNSKLDQESDTANQYWQELKQTENEAAKELAQTPLLLTFLCLIYEREQELPNQRSTLYGRALDILLRDWSAQKRLERNSVYKYLRPEFEKELLNEIAYNSFEEDRLFFLKSDITDRINDYLSDTANIPAELDGSAVLEAIEVQQGILVERATDTYSFSHLTLQEYLTASYISSEWSIQELVSEHLTDERWREVFLLVSGLAGRRSHELWLAMEQQANAFISSPRLQGLLQWVMRLSDRSLPSNQILVSRAWLLYCAIAFAIARASAIDLVSDRAFAIDIVSDSDIAKAIVSASASASVSVSDIAIVSDIDIDKVKVKAIDLVSDSASASAFARAIDSASASARAIVSDSTFARAFAFAFAIASARASASVVNYETLSKKLEELENQTPSNEATSDEWLNFANQLTETFLTFFHLDRELVTLSLEEAQSLGKYLTATKLIIDCKNAAVRVSRKEWEAIESRLLTPPITENQD